MIRRFLRRWLLPLTLGPAVTIAAVAGLWIAEEKERVPPAFEIVSGPDNSVIGIVTASEDLRDVTPAGVTPGPEVSGTLERIRPPEQRESVLPPREILFRRIIVVSPASFRAVVAKKPVEVVIAGIKAPHFTDICTDDSGAKWKCGAKARAELARLIGGRAVGCVMVDVSVREFPIANCHVGRDDLADWMIENGWADPSDPNDRDKAALAEKAKTERRGRYGNAPLGVIAG